MELQIKGIDALIKKMDRLATDVQKDVQAELNDWADQTAANAKMLVSSNSSDEGLLLRSINPNYGNGSASVTAATKYAAYIEFGTRKFAAAYVSSLPADWQTYAATFKGKTGGTFEQFILSIKAWAARKGITDKGHIYFIIKQIMRDGISPKPFMYPSVNKTLPILKQNLRAIFKL
jgi:HK97 gp10 family phage protein